MNLAIVCGAAADVGEWEKDNKYHSDVSATGRLLYPLLLKVLDTGHLAVCMFKDYSYMEFT